MAMFLEEEKKSVGGIERGQDETQVGFKEGRSTLDHILTLRTLFEQEIFVGPCLYSFFVDFKKAFDTIPRDKLWEHLQRLGVLAHLQQDVKAMYTAKV